MQAVRYTHRYYSTQTIKYVPRVLHDFTTRASSFILTHFLFEKFEKFNFSGLFLVFSFQMSTSCIVKSVRIFLQDQNFIQNLLRCSFRFCSFYRSYVGKLQGITISSLGTTEGM